MKDKIQVYKNGYCTMEKTQPAGYYKLKVYIRDDLHDKIMCDDYQEAMGYWKVFKAIARSAK